MSRQVGKSWNAYRRAVERVADVTAEQRDKLAAFIMDRERDLLRRVTPETVYEGPGIVDNAAPDPLEVLPLAAPEKVQKLNPFDVQAAELVAKQVEEVMQEVDFAGLELRLADWLRRNGQPDAYENRRGNSVGGWHHECSHEPMVTRRTTYGLECLMCGKIKTSGKWVSRNEAKTAAFGRLYGSQTGRLSSRTPNTSDPEPRSLPNTGRRCGLGCHIRHCTYRPEVGAIYCTMCSHYRFDDAGKWLNRAEALEHWNKLNPDKWVVPVELTPPVKETAFEAEQQCEPLAATVERIYKQAAEALNSSSHRDLWRRSPPQKPIAPRGRENEQMREQTTITRRGLGSKVWIGAENPVHGSPAVLERRVIGYTPTGYIVGEDVSAIGSRNQVFENVETVGDGGVFGSTDKAVRALVPRCLEKSREWAELAIRYQQNGAVSE